MADSTESPLLLFLKDSLLDLQTRRQQIDLQLQQLQEEKCVLGQKEVRIQSLIRSFSGPTKGTSSAHVDDDDDDAG